jgi:hypothetical protein
VHGQASWASAGVRRRAMDSWAIDLVSD